MIQYIYTYVSYFKVAFLSSPQMVETPLTTSISKMLVTCRHLFSVIRARAVPASENVHAQLNHYVISINLLLVQPFQSREFSIKFDTVISQDSDLY